MEETRHGAIWRVESIAIMAGKPSFDYQKRALSPRRQYFFASSPSPAYLAPANTFLHPHHAPPRFHNTDSRPRHRLSRHFPSTFFAPCWRRLITLRAHRAMVKIVHFPLSRENIRRRSLSRGFFRGFSGRERNTCRSGVNSAPPGLMGYRITFFCEKEN